MQGSAFHWYGLVLAATQYLFPLLALTITYTRWFDTDIWYISTYNSDTWYISTNANCQMVK